MLRYLDNSVDSFVKMYNRYYCYYRYLVIVSFTFQLRKLHSGVKRPLPGAFSNLR